MAWWNLRPEDQRRAAPQARTAFKGPTLSLKNFSGPARPNCKRGRGSFSKTTDVFCARLNTSWPPSEMASWRGWVGLANLGRQSFASPSESSSCCHKPCCSQSPGLLRLPMEPEFVYSPRQSTMYMNIVLRGCDPEQAWQLPR